MTKQVIRPMMKAPERQQLPTRAAIGEMGNGRTKKPCCQQRAVSLVLPKSIAKELGSRKHPLQCCGALALWETDMTHYLERRRRR